MRLQPRYPNIRPDRTARYYWYLNEDVVATLTDGRQFFIPKGFRFDGHSVPRLIWAFIPPFGLDIYAALVHDALTRLSFPRQYADKQYRAFHFLSDYCVSPLRSHIMSATVTAWGYVVKYTYGISQRLY